MRHRVPLRNVLRCGSGSSAVEFALVVPLFLGLFFGIVVCGSYLSVLHGVQQLAAEAARASISGLSDGERATIAQQTIAMEVRSYPFIDPTHLSITSAKTDPTTSTFSIVLTYDATNLAIFRMPFFPTPSAIIQRSASIQRGGY